MLKPRPMPVWHQRLVGHRDFFCASYYVMQQDWKMSLLLFGSSALCVWGSQ